MLRPRALDSEVTVPLRSYFRSWFITEQQWDAWKSHWSTLGLLFNILDTNSNYHREKQELGAFCTWLSLFVTVRTMVQGVAPFWV